MNSNKTALNERLTQERRENSMLRAEQSRAELGRNLIWNSQSFSIDCYLRLLANNGADISAVKVTKSDGTETDYKIIDRR